MAENLPLNFAVPTESTIASYDWTNFAEGTGIRTFYIANGKNSAGTQYFLTTQAALVSYTTQYGGTSTTSTSAVKTDDIDYDLSPFNKPQTIRGTASLHGTWSVNDAAGGGYVYLIIRVRKWDGTNETEVGSFTSETLSSANTKRNLIGTFACTETHFKIGDILRITVEIWTRSATGAASRVGFYGQDPASTSITTNYFTATDPTFMKINIPFKIEV